LILLGKLGFKIGAIWRGTKELTLTACAGGRPGLAGAGVRGRVGPRLRRKPLLRLELHGVTRRGARVRPGAGARWARGFNVFNIGPPGGQPGAWGSGPSLPLCLPLPRCLPRLPRCPVTPPARLHPAPRLPGLPGQAAPCPLGGWRHTWGSVYKGVYKSPSKVCIVIHTLSFLRVPWGINPHIPFSSNSLAIVSVF
jgi:hypothetical protein